VHNLRTVASSSLIFLTAISSGNYKVQFLAANNNLRELTLSSCQTTSSEAQVPALAVSSVPGSGVTFAITAVSSQGTTVTFYNIVQEGSWTTRSVHPAPTIDGSTNLTLPHSAKILDRLAPDVFILGALIAQSDIPVPVLARRDSSNNWLFSWISGDDFCNINPKPVIRHFKASPDGSVTIFAAYSTSTAAFRVYVALTANISAAVPLLNPSVFLEWKSNDLENGIPVVFLPGNQFTLLARPTGSGLLNAYRFDPSGQWLGTYASSFGDTNSFLVHLAVSKPTGPLLYFIDSASNIVVACSGTNCISISTCQGSCHFARIGRDFVFMWDEYSPANVTIIRNSIYSTNTTVSNRVLDASGPVGNETSPFFFMLSSKTTGSTSDYFASVYTNSNFNDSLVQSFFEPAEARICGSWPLGFFFSLETSLTVQYWHYNVTSGSSLMIDSRSLAGHACKQIGDLPRFLLTFEREHKFIDLATAPALIGSLPNLFHGTFILQSDVIPASGPQFGLTLLATVRMVSPTTVDETFIIPTNRCFDDMDCFNTNQCRNGTCIAVTVVPPDTQTCVGDPPIAGAVCIAGVWVVQGDVIVSTTVVITGNTQINGSLIITSPNATISLSGTSTLTILDCASFAGALNVTRPRPDSSEADKSITVITFSGYCGGIPSTFNTTSLTFENPEACAKQETMASPQYTDTSVSILFSYDRSGCETSATTGALSVGAIAGIVVGIVAFLAIIITIILVLKFKGVIRPYSRKGGSEQHELD
jgi:hypothetical protein